MLYHLARELRQLDINISAEGVASFTGEKYLVDEEGLLVNKPDIKYSIPKYAKSMKVDDTFIDKQIYFQKWSTQTNIPFWKSKHEEGSTTDVVILIQAHIDHTGRSEEKNFVSLIRNTENYNFKSWGKDLKGKFLDYVSDYVIYFCIRTGGFIYCFDIEFLDTDGQLMRFANVKEKEKGHYTLLAANDNQKLEIKKVVHNLTYLPFLEVDNAKVKAFIIGHKVTDEYSYRNFMT